MISPFTVILSGILFICLYILYAHNRIAQKLRRIEQQKQTLRVFTDEHMRYMMGYYSRHGDETKQQAALELNDRYEKYSEFNMKEMGVLYADMLLFDRGICETPIMNEENKHEQAQKEYMTLMQKECRIYNEAVKQYNNAIKTKRGALIACMFNLEQADLFNCPE